jgi:hypothetical protein
MTNSETGDRNLEEVAPAVRDSADASWSTLGADVYVAILNDDLVFLDVSADAYSCVPGGGEGALISIDRRSLSLEDPKLAAELHRAGFLEAVRVGAQLPLSSNVPPLIISAVRANYPSPRLRDLGPALVICADLVDHYRGKPFVQILNKAREGHAQFLPSNPGDLRERVDQFHRLSPYLPISGKCLLRSFALLRWLQRHGHRATWVFGVATWPFRAHCWLEVDNMVLDDQPDEIAVFTPILTV